MEPAARGDANYVTIGCRFVPNDQWLVTHLDTSWKIADVKRWLLAKCLPELFTPVQPFQRPRSSQRKRPVSPILFASRTEIDNEAGHPSAGDDFGDEHHDADPEELASSFYQEKFKYTPGPSFTTTNVNIIPTSNSVVVGQFLLLAFSTGQVLEDHNLLSWYTLHPHEFLELHYHNCIVKLPREDIEDYVEPYFEAKVWALKAIAGSDDSEAARAAGGLGRSSEAGDAERDRAKKKKTKLQWHERWVVIHRGLFQLCAEREPESRHSHLSAPLESLVSLRGAEYLEYMRGSSSAFTFLSPPTSHHASSHSSGSPVAAEKRIVCAKFRVEERNGSSTLWRKSSKDVIMIDPLRKGSSAGLDFLPGDDDAVSVSYSRAEDTILIVMDMLEDTAYSHILRILHRYAPTIPSSFFPASTRVRSPRRRSYSPISFATGSSPATSIHASPETSPATPSQELSDEMILAYTSVRYPEWRLELMRRAKRAGLGNVGQAMEWAMFGAETPEQDEDVVATTGYEFGTAGHERDDDNDDDRSRSRGKEKIWGIELESDSSSGDESASEREWEGWEGDLFSQRARGREGRTNRFSNTQTRRLQSWATLPSGEYSFPSTSLDEPRDSTLPKQTLSSYSSADSLLRRTIKRASPRKNPPLRSASPTIAPGIRSRPISPLAGQLDPFDEDLGMSTSPGKGRPIYPLYSYPRVAYPTRNPTIDSGGLVLLSSGTAGATSTHRGPLPISMTMTSITSTVSVGSAADARSANVNADKGRFGHSEGSGSSVNSKESKTKRKNKGKERASEGSGSFDSSSQVQTPVQSIGESFASVVSGGYKRPRKRSSTLQLGAIPQSPHPALTHKPSLSEASVEGTSSLRSRKSTDRLLGDTQSVAGLSTPKSPKGKLKLSLSFAQVAASSPNTTPRPSVSAASESSFESPRFAHPDDSDED